MDSWDQEDVNYSRSLLNKIRLLLNKLNELPNKYIMNVRMIQDSFLNEFSSSTQIVMNLCAKVLSTGIDIPPSTFSQKYQSSKSNQLKQMNQSNEIQKDNSQQSIVSEQIQSIQQENQLKQNIQNNENNQINQNNEIIEINESKEIQKDVIKQPTMKISKELKESKEKDTKETKLKQKEYKEIKEKYSETYSSDSEGPKRSYTRKKEKILKEEIEHLNKQITELKTAQESTWTALLCANKKYTELLTLHDKMKLIFAKEDFLYQKSRVLLESNEEFKQFSDHNVLVYREQLRQIQPFCEMITFEEIEQIQEWTNAEEFQLIYHGTSLPKKRLETKKGIIGLMRNNNYSVFGIFTRNSIEPSDQWLPPNCDFCFSLRSLFLKEPLKLLVTKNGKVLKCSDSQFIDTALIEITTSQPKDILYVSIK